MEPNTTTLTTIRIFKNSYVRRENYSMDCVKQFVHIAFYSNVKMQI